MRDLSEIITRRALELIREANDKAMDHGEGEVDEGVIGDRMAEYMGGDPRSVRKQLRRYLYEGHLWRADYIQAFCRAVGVEPQRLVSLDPVDGVSEATRAQLMWSALGERFPTQQERQFIRNVQQLLDNPDRFDLAQKLSVIVSQAGSKAEAIDQITAVLHDSADVLNGKTRNLRGRSPRRRKVSKKP